MWEKAEQGVTFVVRKSIDCHSRHYSLSQETKANKGEGCDRCDFEFLLGAIGLNWLVLTCDG